MIFCVVIICRLLEAMRANEIHFKMDCDPKRLNLEMIKNDLMRKKTLCYCYLSKVSFVLPSLLSWMSRFRNETLRIALVH